MEPDLRAMLESFDGVHIEPLETIVDTLPAEPHILRGLTDLALSDAGKLQSASTWLLKRFLEDGATLDQAQTVILLEVLTRGSHWEAKLHVLQMLDKLTIEEAAAESLWNALTAATEHRNKLLRAWSYHGIAVVADQHPGFRGDAVRYLSQGEADEAASVRARIRRLRKSIAWLKF